MAAPQNPTPRRPGDPPSTRPPSPTGTGADLPPTLVPDTSVVADHFVTRATLSQTTPAADEVRPRAVVPGYDILSELGRGGMGVVYKARHLALNRVVALKMILAGAHAGAQDRLRFKAEAEVIARLQHPNVVQIYEVGEAEDYPFFAMEFVPGGSLAAKVAGTPQPPRDAARLVEALARAVDAAHRQGIVHRDLKPANVLLAADGTPKITDFGLARRLDAEAGPTQTDSVMGTPSYMAPEQAAGRTREAGPAADVYSLGAILYDLVTGRPPFRGETVVDTLDQVRSREPVSVRQLTPKCPRDLETVCHKCLQKEPHRRYGSALELAEDLERFRTGEAILARPVGVGERAVKWTKRHPAIAALSATVFLVTCVGMGLVFWQWQRAEFKAEEEAEARRDAVKAKEAEETAKRLEEQRRRQAEQAREEAQLARRDEEAARKDAVAQFYFSNVALAHREWQAGNVGRVEELLNECPRPLRRWEWHFLKRQTNASRLTVISRGQGTGFGVVFSPDGRRVAAGAGNNNITIWDANSGQVHKEMGAGWDGKLLESTRIAFSPDGRQIVSAGLEGGVVFWDSETGQKKRTFQPHRGGTLGVAFSPDGKRLATCGEDKLVKVWELATGKEDLSLEGHTDAVLCVRFSADGDRIASGGAFKDSSVRVWDAKTGKELFQLRNKPVDGALGKIEDLAFHPDGQHLVTSSTSIDAGVRVWDLQTGKQVHILTEPLLFSHAVAYSKDGKYLAAAGHDSAVRVWHVPTYQEAFRLRGHATLVKGVAFSPEGDRLATSSEDGVVKVWDVGTELETSRIVPSKDQTWCSAVGFSADGRWIALAAERDNNLYLRDAATGREGAICRGHEAVVAALAFSADGKRLASVDRGGGVRLWETASGELVRALKAPPGEKAAESDRAVLCFGPEDRWLAAASGGGRVRVWNTGDGRLLHSFNSFHTIVTPTATVRDSETLALSADGKTFASGGLDRKVRLWETTGKELKSLFSTNPVNSLAFRPDGRVLVAAHGLPNGMNSLTFWDPSAGRELLTVAGHPARITSLAFSSDGRRLASAGDDRTVRIWDAETGRELLQLRGKFSLSRELVFSPDGSRLVLPTTEGARVWDGTRGREVLTLSKQWRIVGMGLAMGPDGRLAASCGDRLTVRDAETGREVQSIPWVNTSQANPLQLSALVGLAFSPDGRYLAGGGGNLLNRGDLVVWDAKTGRVVHTLPGHTKVVRIVSFSGDSRRLVSASIDYTVKVWNVASGKGLMTLSGHKDNANCAAFSPDDTMIATGSRDKSVKFWDAETGKEKPVRIECEQWVSTLAFHPSGRRLVTAGGGEKNTELKLWDVTTGKMVFALRGHTGPVYGVAFSPNGRLIASSGADRTVRIWEAETGRQLLELRGHFDRVHRVAFSPDGRLLASSAEDQTVRVWDVTGLAGPGD